MAFARYWPVVRLTMAYKLLFIFLISHVALAWNADSDENNGDPVNRLYRMAGGVNIRSDPEAMKNYGSRPLMSREENPLRWGNYYDSPYNYAFTASGMGPTNSYEPLVATILQQIAGPLHSPAYNPTSMPNLYATPGLGYNPPLTGTTYPLSGAGHIYNPSGHLPPVATYGSGIPGAMHQPSVMLHPYNTPGYGHTYISPAPSPYQTTGQPYYSPLIPPYNPSGQSPMGNTKGYVGAGAWSYAWNRMISQSILNNLLNQQAQALAEASPNQLPSNMNNLPIPPYNPSGQSGTGNTKGYAGAGGWSYAWNRMISQSILNDLLNQQAQTLTEVSPNQLPSNVNNFQSTGLMNKQMGPTPTYETGTDHPCMQPVTPGPTPQDVKQMGNLMKLVRVLLRDHHRGNKDNSNSDNPFSKEEGCNLRSGAIESGDATTSEEIPELRKKPVRKASPFSRER